MIAPLQAICVFAGLLVVAPGFAVAEPYHSGYRHLTTAGDLPVPVSIWYPTRAAEAPFRAGAYEIAATPDAPLAPGRHRLVVISHGTLGSDLSHHDLAEFLARNGVVVAAPRHLGDSYDRPEGQGTDVQLIGRPWQIVQTIDAVLADATLGPAIDPNRIGMVGFSAGGYTTLVIAGARPRWELWEGLCAGQTGGVCLDGRPLAARFTRPGWQLPHETRIKAAVAMAPLGILFDKAALAGVTIPMRIYAAQGDRELVNARNADHIIDLLPRPPEHASIPGGHYIFLAPCSAALAAAMSEICTDAPGIDRAAIHRQINAEVADFFDRTLGPD